MAKKYSAARIPIRHNIYCVIRTVGNFVFHEMSGSKADCMNYANNAPKRCLRVCKLEPIAKWDKHGNRIGIKR